MKKLLKYSVLSICAVIFLIGAIITVKGYAMYCKVLRDNPPAQAIEKIKSDEDYVSIDVLPQMYLDAVIAVEDRRFYYHPGIDIISIGRAVLTDIREMKLVEGGSTITQQFAKNIFLPSQKNLNVKLPRCLWLCVLSGCIPRMKYWSFM